MNKCEICKGEGTYENSIPCPEGKVGCLVLHTENKKCTGCGGSGKVACEKPGNFSRNNATRQKLVDQINSAPEELRSFIHDMETWDHTEAAYELLHLREQAKAQDFLIQTLRARLRKVGLSNGLLETEKKSHCDKPGCWCKTPLADY